MPKLYTTEHGNYIHQNLIPSFYFEVFRTKKTKGHRLVFGCPTGKWNPKVKKCLGGMKLHKIEHPKSEYYKLCAKGKCSVKMRS